VGKGIDHSPSGCWRFNDQFVHAWRVFPCVDLCYSPDTYQSIGVAFQHEFLKRARLFLVALLCGPKDPLSQITNSPVGFAPIDGIPIRLLLASVCRECFSHLTFPLMSNLYLVLWVMHQDHVSRLSAWISPISRPYLPSYVFLLPFGRQPSLLDPSCSH
jgi:hypothetical protein